MLRARSPPAGSAPAARHGNGLNAPDFASVALPLKNPPHLLRPRQAAGLDQVVDRHGRRHAPEQQALEHVGRQIRQPHDPADIPVRHILRPGDVLERGCLAALKSPPPRPRAPEGAQDMWVRQLSRSEPQGPPDLRRKPSLFPKGLRFRTEPLRLVGRAEIGLFRLIPGEPHSLWFCREGRLFSTPCKL